MPTDRQNSGSSITGFYKSLYLPNRFFYVLFACILGLVLCFIFDALFVIMQIILGVAVVILFLDIISLYRLRNGVLAYRSCPDRLSNGDLNRISVFVKNKYAIKIRVKIVEEVPFQFQKRDLIYESKLVDPDQDISFSYDLRPTKRGVYQFGGLNVFVKSGLGLIEKRYNFALHKSVTVYPSFIDMHKYELLAISNRLTDYGIKKIRRIGQSTEFDNIKHYVLGDDPRTINYKATARTNQLMVNTYQEERSQSVYCIIDKGRVMEMPFNEMTLLDYAINSSLMVCSTAINKGDKAGLITFSSHIDEILAADKKAGQKNKILEMLYKQQTNFLESDYEKLYAIVKRKLTQRCLIVLYTNFETVNGMRRQLRYLSRLAKDHLLLVTFFVNSEFNEILNATPEDIEGVFEKGTAEKLAYDKLLIVKELNRYGIHTLLSTPDNLTIDSINKYLEFKSRGLI